MKGATNKTASALLIHQAIHEAQNEWLMPEADNVAAPIAAPNAGLNIAAAPSKPKNSLSVVSRGFCATNRRTSQAPASASRVSAVQKPSAV